MQIAQIPQKNVKTNGFTDETINLSLDAVDRLLISLGYSEMSMQDVANESGIETRKLYLYFRNKGDLVLAREDRITDSVKMAWQRIARRSGAWDQKIHEMLYLRVMLRFKSYQHFPESLDDMSREVGPDLREREELYCKEEARLLSSVLQEGRKVVSLQQHGHASLADTLITATNALLPFHLTRQKLRNRREVEERIARIIEILLRGLPGRHRMGCHSPVSRKNDERADGKQQRRPAGPVPRKFPNRPKLAINDSSLG